MRTIHHEERVIPAYDETVYGYDDLSAEAKANAFANFRDSGEGERLYHDFIDDMAGYLNDFCRATGAHFEIDAWNNARVWASVDDIFEYDRPRPVRYVPRSKYVDCYEMDIADAWNAHMERLQELDAYLNSDECEDTRSAYRAICDEIYDACHDVAKVCSDSINGNYDYYMSDTDDDFFLEWDAYEHEYTEDGEIY